MIYTICGSRGSSFVSSVTSCRGRQAHHRAAVHGVLRSRVGPLAGPPLLLRNDGGNRNHWIAIRARGRESNRFGIGSKVRVSSGGHTQLREINPYGSYLSSSEVRLYIGLGRETTIARLEIKWPSGKKQTLENVPSNQSLLLDEANASR